MPRRFVELKDLSELIIEYVKIIKHMESIRELEEKSLINIYVELDRRRGESHDKILEVAGASRGDRDFELALAKHVQAMLEL